MGFAGEAWKKKTTKKCKKFGLSRVDSRQNWVHRQIAANLFLRNTMSYGNKKRALPECAAVIVSPHPPRILHRNGQCCVSTTDSARGKRDITAPHRGNFVNGISSKLFLGEGGSTISRTASPRPLPMSLDGAQIRGMARRPRFALHSWRPNPFFLQGAFFYATNITRFPDVVCVCGRRGVWLAADLLRRRALSEVHFFRPFSNHRSHIHP